LKVSNTTLDFINDLKQFSSGKLKQPDDIAFLYEISTITKQEKLFGDIIFTAKYINGLGKIIHGNVSTTGATKPIDESALDKIKTEFKDNLQKLTSQLNILLENADPDDRSDFVNKYLSPTHESLVNIINLIYDLSWVKKWWNRGEAPSASPEGGELT
jgi:hypothetical protein